MKDINQELVNQEMVVKIEPEFVDNNECCSNHARIYPGSKIKTIKVNCRDKNVLRNMRPKSI